MEGRLFTFFGAIGGHGQEWIILSHLALTVVIVMLVARAATTPVPSAFDTGSPALIEAAEPAATVKRATGAVPNCEAVSI